MRPRSCWFSERVRSIRVGTALGREERHRQIDVDHLGEGVYPGVGASGANDQWLINLERAGQRFAQHADDGGELGLVGESGERASVVGDIQTPALDVSG